MFEIPRHAVVNSALVFETENMPGICEGGEIFDTLCPISKETGFRENALSLLTKVLDPAKQGLLQQVLQNVPSLQSEIQGMSDNEALDLVCSRFDQGTPYENQVLRDRLQSSFDVLFPQSTLKEGFIGFEQSDGQAAKEESKV